MMARQNERKASKESVVLLRIEVRDARIIAMARVNNGCLETAAREEEIERKSGMRMEEEVVG